LDCGGIESWLQQLAPVMAARGVDCSLAYHRCDSAAMAQALRRCGFHTYALPSPRSPLRYLMAYRRLLRDAGPFSAIQSHLNFPGLLMLGARLEGVPVRIAQSHVAPALMTAGVVAGGYARLTNRLFLRHATHRFAVSPAAAVTLFGKHWRRGPAVELMRCGINLGRYANTASSGLRARLGILETSPVLGTIGRLSAEKNQAFALSLVRQLREARPDVRLVLIGAGDQHERLSAQVESLGITEAVHFLGERSDVPELLRAVIDVLLLPSLTEGSPLTVIEAQAAGVYCLASPAVPPSCVLNPRLARILPLDVSAWVGLCDRLLRAPPGVAARDAAMRALRDSPYDVVENARRLEQAYRSDPTATHTRRGHARPVDTR
jgi:glycosyltransferase involved in cell wall biosynthesis